MNYFKCRYHTHKELKRFFLNHQIGKRVDLMSYGNQIVEFKTHCNKIVIVDALDQLKCSKMKKTLLLTHSTYCKTLNK